MLFSLNFKLYVQLFFDLNSKTLFAYDLGRIRADDYMYNADETLEMIQNVYKKATSYGYFSGVLVAKRIPSAPSPSVWRIDGVRNNDENGYLKIGTYVEGYVEHTLSGYQGNWKWID